VVSVPITILTSDLEVEFTQVPLIAE
jgi:hypothetical protein